MSKKDFQVFLYKNKLNESKLMDIYLKLSDNTLTSIMKDLGEQPVVSSCSKRK